MVGIDIALHAGCAGSEAAGAPDAVLRCGHSCEDESFRSIRDASSRALREKRCTSKSMRGHGARLGDKRHGDLTSAISAMAAIMPAFIATHLLFSELLLLLLLV